MTKIIIPAGLVDENIEIFSFENKPYALYKGQRIPFLELPDQILELIWAELTAQESAYLALSFSGYESKTAKLEKYAMCRFGGFDTAPDILNGQIVHSEYFDCGFRSVCAMEGIVCKNVVHNGRILTPDDMKMM